MKHRHQPHREEPGMKPSPHHLRAMQQSLMQAQFATTCEILAEGRSEGKADELFQNVLAFADQMIGHDRSPVACRPGCWWCCTIPVAVSPLEALLLAQALKAQLDPRAYIALALQLRARVTEQAADTFEQRVRAQRRCVLLDQEANTCTIYPVRPLACRGYASLDKDACERSFQRQHQPTVPVAALTMALTRGVADGLAYGLIASHLDGHRYELCEALLTAMETPDAMARYLEGDALFAHLTPVGAPSQKQEASMLVQLDAWYDREKPRRERGEAINYALKPGH